MKWFKHFSDASDDEFVAHLESEMGHTGYAIWFKTLEMVADQMKPDSAPILVLPESKWRSSLGVNRKKLKNFLETSEKFFKINSVYNGKFLSIEVPKLLEIRDNSTKILSATNKKKAKTLPLEVDVEVEGEEDLIIDEIDGMGEVEATGLSAVVFAFQKAYKLQPGQYSLDSSQRARLRAILAKFQAADLCADIARIRAKKPDLSSIEYFLVMWEKPDAKIVATVATVIQMPTDAERQAQRAENERRLNARLEKNADGKWVEVYRD